MKKGTNLEVLFSVSRKRSLKTVILVGVFYVFLVSFEAPFLLKNGLDSVSHTTNSKLFSEENLEEKQAAHIRRPHRETTPFSGLNFTAGIVNNNISLQQESGILKSAKHALTLGRKLWEELIVKNNTTPPPPSNSLGGLIIHNNSSKVDEKCPDSISIRGDEFSKVMMLPCGLTLGSHITLVAKPRAAHVETNPKIAHLKDGEHMMVSQYMMELLGLKTVEEGEDPPRILHFNPRIKGDWSEKPVIEHNTCYRMQWGTSQRCQGSKSEDHEDTVDGMVKCENWIRNDDDNRTSEGQSKGAKWWLNRLIGGGRTKKMSFDWPFPFVEEKLFVLTLSAGLEGYHIHVNGRHLTSFPYRVRFTLEDATGLSLAGDIDVHSIFAGSLPTSLPTNNFSPERHLDMSERWKSPTTIKKPVELFIGILSAGNHFTERMAVRKSWMQHNLIKSSNVVARFFVALHSRNEVNVQVKKEADFFGDIVFVPYVDNYDLVVLKTVAICEYGVRAASAKYILKCDDDTFVRVDAIVNQAMKVAKNKSFYIGNINYYHKPLRSGKWAVTYEEWPEEHYPNYANGPGYIISSDIANFIVSDFEKHKLRLFKMEDVSMGMWVKKFNSSRRAVEYVHSLKFCQFGCVEDYIIAHYQSPRQMICLWNKLKQQGRPICCNMR
ncbi:hypothetical protein ACJIZ3_003415 [Penstemon smallii]|uniref:Galectin domain-containing protein n=1 Tax=Penstemon smallii TaxID=265156 RepID=A0ABD3UAE5_9LAMI